MDSRAATPLIRRTLIIILTGTIGARITLIPSRIITLVPDTPGITGVELIPATIAIIITTAIELK